jgi:hypothetical protein
MNRPAMNRSAIYWPTMNRPAMNPAFAVPPSTPLDFGLPWIRLVVGRRFLVPLIMCLRHWWHLNCWTPYRVKNCTSSCTHHLLFLSHIPCEEPSSQRRAIGSLTFLSAPTFHCHTRSGSRSRRSLTLSDVPVKITADIFTSRITLICSFDSLLYLQTHVVFLVSQELPSTQIRWKLRNSCCQKPQFVWRQESSYFQPQTCILSFFRWSLSR